MAATTVIRAEMLEDRFVATAGLFFDAATGLLTINGGDNNDFADVKVYEGNDGKEYIAALVQRDDSGMILDIDSLIIAGEDLLDIDYFGRVGNDLFANYTDLSSYITGGEGNDTLIGGNAHDTIYGMNGDDFIQGWNGQDILHGGNGNDTVMGLEGNDFITGLSGDDSLTGNTGDDYLNGGSGIDTSDNGGLGNDTIAEIP